MIFSAFNRASAFQPLNMSYKLPKTKYKPKFSGLDFISDKKPKYVTLNYWPRGKTDKLKAQHSKPTMCFWVTAFQQPDFLH